MGASSLPFVTRVVLSGKSSESLRVTVPQVVAATLGLHAGDGLSWVVDDATGSVRVERVPPPPALREPDESEASSDESSHA